MKLNEFKAGIVVYDVTFMDARIGVTKRISDIEDEIIVVVDFANEGQKQVKLSHLRKFTKKCKLTDNIVIDRSRKL